MKKEELWAYCREQSVRTYRLYFGFGREILWIKRSDFETIESHFSREKVNLLHKGDSYRSKNVWGHLHAVCYGNFVNVHCDTGNLVMFFPLGIFHFVFDVLPYIPHIVLYKVIYSMDISDALPPE